MVVAGDDAAHMRQLFEHGKSAGAEVEAVHVAGSAADGESGSDRQGAQQGAFSGAAGAEDGQVAFLVGVERDGRLGLVFGVVQDAEDQFVVPAAGGNFLLVGQVVDGLEFGEPRLAGGGNFGELAGGANVGHEPADV